MSLLRRDYLSDELKAKLEVPASTAHVVREASRVPTITGPFSVETWIALGAYPLNWAPVVDLHDPGKSGFFCGIDAARQTRPRLAGGRSVAATHGAWLDPVPRVAPHP